MGRIMPTRIIHTSEGVPWVIGEKLVRMLKQQAIDYGITIIVNNQPIGMIKEWKETNDVSMGVNYTGPVIRKSRYDLAKEGA
jgi:hypothetical protein